VSNLVYRLAAKSDHPFARSLRGAYWGVMRFSLPAPAIVVRPLLATVLFVRSVYYFVARVFVCEPLFKAYCTTYGKNVHTGVFLHWVQGRGRIAIGDNVTVDGKCSFAFAARYSDEPTLTIGSDSGIGHGCSFVVARSITIGERCRIAQNVSMFDSSGHPSDPAARAAGAPAAAGSVRPIVIERNVWIGNGAVIFPGVTIGENSVISAGAVVIAPVPANSLMIGNPARRMASV
jgi:acetyltransferase-like isoleucine patch superfamily enzyme